MTGEGPALTHKMMEPQSESIQKDSMAFDTLNNRGSVSLNYEKEDEYGAEEVQSEAMLE